jgi:hypothetical protein
MKTAIKFITGIFIIGLLATAASAQHLLTLEEGRMNDILTVRLTGLDNKRTTIHVTGLDGKPWLTKHVFNKDQYAAGLDLSQLPDGDYLITTRNQGQRRVKAFNRTGNDITLFQPKTRQTHTGRLTSNRKGKAGQIIVRIDQPESAKAIDVQLANLREERTAVHLTSVEGIPVFSKKVHHANGYARRISLKNVSNGDYLLCIQMPDVSLLQFVTVDGEHITLGQVLSREKGFGKGFLMASRP